MGFDINNYNATSQGLTKMFSDVSSNPTAAKQAIDEFLLAESMATRPDMFDEWGYCRVCSCIANDQNRHRIWHRSIEQVNEIIGSLIMGLMPEE